MYDRPAPDYSAQRDVAEFGAVVEAMVGEIEAGGIPGRPIGALRDDDRGRPARCLSGAARHQPQPVHVPAADAGHGRHRRAPGHRRRQLPGGAGHRHRRRRHNPPDRGHPVAQQDRRGGRAAGQGPARRREGARRAPDARGLESQRPRPRLRTGDGEGQRLQPRRALQPRHAPRVHGVGAVARGQDRARRGDRMFPRGHP